MRLVPSLLATLLTLLSATAGSALDPRVDAGGFRDEDRDIAEEIAGYSADERHAALLVAGFPEDLLEVQQIQRASADEFTKLVEAYPRADQEQIWNLVRFPGLVADLARGGAKSDPELDRIAQRYPEEIRSAIRSEGRDRYKTWVDIYALDLEAEQAFSDVIAAKPPEVRSAFQRLRGKPDLMSVLVDNIGVSTRIGAAYREDPTRVEARFDSLHQDVVARQEQEKKSWAKELQDPKAQEELRAAAREFAKDQGYALDDGTGNTNGNANGNTNGVQTQVVHVDHYVDNYNSYPNYAYPYWFGYPSWYAYPYWYPASLWTHVGFRFGGGSSFISVGLPSPYFLGWYNNFYYGPGYGYGYGGYGYGYGGYGLYGGYWGPSHNYYNGHHNHQQFRSAHYYDNHRPRQLDGHRSITHHADGFRHGQGRPGMGPNGQGQNGQGQSGAWQNGQGQSFGGHRRDTRDPGLSPSHGGRDGSAPGHGGSRIDGGRGDRGGRSFHADPRQNGGTLGGGRGDPSQGGAFGGPGGPASGHGSSGRTPDVSSPPPGHSRFDRAGHAGGQGGRFDRNALTASNGGPPAELRLAGHGGRSALRHDASFQGGSRNGGAYDLRSGGGFGGRGGAGRGGSTSAFGDFGGNRGAGRGGQGVGGFGRGGHDGGQRGSFGAPSGGGGFGGGHGGHGGSFGGGPAMGGQGGGFGGGHGGGFGGGRAGGFSGGGHGGGGGHMGGISGGGHGGGGGFGGGHGGGHGGR